MSKLPVNFDPKYVVHCGNGWFFQPYSDRVRMPGGQVVYRPDVAYTLPAHVTEAIDKYCAELMAPIAGRRIAVADIIEGNEFLGLITEATKS